MFYLTLQMRKVLVCTHIVPDLGEIKIKIKNKMGCTLRDEVFGDQESCYVITCFCYKMKIIPATYCFKCIAVSRGNLSLLLYINRLSSAAGQAE